METGAFGWKSGLGSFDQVFKQVLLGVAVDDFSGGDDVLRLDDAPDMPLDMAPAQIGARRASR